MAARPIPKVGVPKLGILDSGLNNKIHTANIYIYMERERERDYA